MPSATSPSSSRSDVDQIASGVLSLAALVHPFDPLDLIQRQVGQSTIAPDIEERVLTLVAKEAGEVVWKPDGSEEPARTFWRLDPAARRRQLARLVDRGDIDSLLRRVEPIKGDRFSHYLRRALGGSPVAVERIPVADRHSANAALSFAADALDGTRAEAVRETSVALHDRLVRQVEEERIKAILPNRLFGRGRERKTFELFAKVGLTREELPRPPSAPFDVRPYLLTGSPGSGKSAFVVDLVRRRRQRDFSGPPVVLLDFDRPNLVLGDSFDWMVELTRQLGLGHPELDRSMKDVRANVRLQMRSAEADEATALLLGAGTLKEQLEPVLGDSSLAGSVLLLVLDTFEEVITRSGLQTTSTSDGVGRTLMERLLEWVDSLAKLNFKGSAIFPTVRVIAAGRAAPTSDQALLARWFCAHDELGPLSEGAALKFLRSRDSHQRFDDRSARDAVRVVGGHPLTLILLERYARNASDTELAETIRNQSITAVMGAEAATRSLYTRFVARMHVGTAVRDGVTKAMLQAAAVPGLVLRELTASLLKDVVAPACEFDPIEPEIAEALLLQLADQGWLIERVADRVEPTYRHCSNVRRLMLPMIVGGEADSSDLIDDVATIHKRQSQVFALRRRAVDWFNDKAATFGIAARAEAAYHRAFLDDVLPWATDDILCRAVAQLAGEDILTMPLAARAILRYHQLGPLLLSPLEAGALPFALREETDLQQRSLALGQARNRSIGELASLIDGAPRRLRLTGRSSYESFGQTGSVSSRAYSVEPSYGSKNRSFAGRSLTVRIAEAFVSGDFAGAASLGLDALVQDDQWPNLSSQVQFKGDLTKHWIWQSSLARLALQEDLDAGDRSLIENLALGYAERLPSPIRPNAIGMLLLTATSIAARRRPPMSDAVERLPSFLAEFIGRADTPYDTRLLALSRHWSTIHERSYAPFDVQISTRQLRIFSHPFLQLLTRGSLGYGRGSNATSVDSFTRRLITFIDRARRETVVCADTQHLGRARTAWAFVPWFGPNIDEEYTRANRFMLTDLHETILRALINADRGHMEAVDEAITAISDKAPFWPRDLPPHAMKVYDRDKRGSLLTRCVFFVDQCGLLEALLYELSSRLRDADHFKSLVRLMHRYESLLHEGYERPTDTSFSSTLA